MRKNTKYIRNIGAAAVILFVVSAADASAFGRFTMGIKGGLNSANLRIVTENTISSYQSRNEFTWGGFLAYRLNGLFSLQVEVLDAPKGSRLIQPVAGLNTDLTFMYSYTEVPILIKLAQGAGGGVLPSVYGGVYWAKLRDAQIRTVTNTEDITEPMTDVRSSDFGLVFGFSLGYKLGGVWLIGDIRYDLGLVDVDTFSGSTVNNRGFSFTLGIGI